LHSRVTIEAGFSFPERQIIIAGGACPTKMVDGKRRLRSTAFFDGPIPFGQQ
jgi:hypothetical protein